MPDSRYGDALLGLGKRAMQQPQEIRERRTAAEETYSQVRARLGGEGSYDSPAAGGQTLPSGGEGQAESIFTTEKKEGFKGSQGTSVTKLDPKAASDRALGSTEGRIMSRLTAEAEQLIARDGPLYNEMLSNIQLPIIEGAAAMAQANTEELRRSMRKGGAARRNAFNTVQKIRAQESINAKKGMNLANARAGLDKWARENARTQMKANESWASNIGGVRESYQTAMDSASELMLDRAIPLMMDSVKDYAKYREHAKAQNRARANGWITGALGVATMVVGGMAGSPGLVSAGTGLLTSSLGPGPAFPGYDAESYARDGSGSGASGSGALAAGISGITGDEIATLKRRGGQAAGAVKSGAGKVGGAIKGLFN